MNTSNLPLANGLVITGTRCWLNRADSSDFGRDYRIATMSLTLNGMIEITDFKVFLDRDTGERYIKFPGKYIKTNEFPDGTPFDHVRIKDRDVEQSMCEFLFDKLNKELEKLNNN